MRVCYFGTYRREYSRNKIMISGLRANGVDVVECHETLWHGIDDRVAVVSGGWRKPAFWWRVFRTYARLLRKYFKVRNYDVMVVGYPGQFDVFLARLLTKIKKRPLVWDVLMSIYQVSIERGLDSINSKTIKWLKIIEHKASNLPDLLIMDTLEHAKFYSELQNVSFNKFGVVPLGADSKFYNVNKVSDAGDGKFHVCYYGSFIRNHGVEFIIEAAKLVKDDDIVFDMIGEGPEKDRLESLAVNLKNIIFWGYLKDDIFFEKISEADICLGVFGNTSQSLVSINNKIYECMAMGKAIITGESEAISNLFGPSKPLLLVRRENHKDIADAILLLKNNDNLRKILAESSKSEFCNRFSTDKIGCDLRKQLLFIRSQTNLKNQ